MKLPKILTKEGLRQLRKSQEFQDFKYFFAPNMKDAKYFLFTLVFLFLFMFILSMGVK